MSPRGTGPGNQSKKESVQNRDAWTFLDEDVLDLRDLIEYLDNYPTSRRDPDWDRDEANLVRRLKRDLMDHDIDRGYAENEPTAIAEKYFEEYAEEFANDIGAINRDAHWPLSHIDWKQAADALKEDYTEFKLGGRTFYVRAY